MNNVEVRVANRVQDWPELEKIRHQVFIKEQGVPEALEWDEADATATHFIAMLNGEAVATARLTAEGQIGRMAVLPQYRNQGVGSELLEFVLEKAKNSKTEQLFLHAQVSAIPFYTRHGFTVAGDVFYEAGIPHRKMARNT
jgi:predicted GNAT family N-acyltransferase